ncbi:hypothetical protein KP2612_003008 [Komagataella phaffii]
MASPTAGDHPAGDGPASGAQLGGEAGGATGEVSQVFQVRASASASPGGTVLEVEVSREDFQGESQVQEDTSQIQVVNGTAHCRECICGRQATGAEQDRAACWTQQGGSVGVRRGVVDWWRFASTNQRCCGTLGGR